MQLLAPFEQEALLLQLFFCSIFCFIQSFQLLALALSTILNPVTTATDNKDAAKTATIPYLFRLLFIVTILWYLHIRFFHFNRLVELALINNGFLLTFSLCYVLPLNQNGSSLEVAILLHFDSTIPVVVLTAVCL